MNQSIRACFGLVAVFLYFDLAILSAPVMAEDNEEARFKHQVRTEYWYKIYRRCKERHYKESRSNDTEAAQKACDRYNPVKTEVRELPSRNESCRTRYPSSGHITDQFDRVSFEAALIDWCDYGPMGLNQDFHSKPCLQGIIFSPAPSYKEIKDAENKCNPVELAIQSDQNHCRTYFRDLMQQGIYLEGSFNNFCQSSPVRSNEENDCLKQKLKKGGVLDPATPFPPAGFGQKTPDHFSLAMRACLDEFKACREDLGEHFGLTKRQDYVYLDQFCSKGEGINPTCMQDFKDSWKLPWNLSNKKRAAELCRQGNEEVSTCFQGARVLAEKYSAQKAFELAHKLCLDKKVTPQIAQCTFTITNMGFFASPRGLNQKKRPFDVLADLTLEFCSMPNQEATACIAAEFAQGLDYRDAERICRMQSQEIRECYRRIIKNYNVFDHWQAREITHYCSIEGKERQCFTQKMNGYWQSPESKLFQTMDTIDSFKKECRALAPIDQDCLGAYRRVMLRSHLSEDNLKRVQESAREGNLICQHETSWVRRCAISRLEDDLKKSEKNSYIFSTYRRNSYHRWDNNPIESMIMSCHSDLAYRTLSELNYAAFPRCESAGH